MDISRSDLKVARILQQDDDFAIIEVGKHDKVTFHLQTNDDGVVVGGDHFLTLLFLKVDNEDKRSMVVWDPFAS